MRLFPPAENTHPMQPRPETELNVQTAAAMATTILFVSVIILATLVSPSTHKAHWVVQIMPQLTWATGALSFVATCSLVLFCCAARSWSSYNKRAEKWQNRGPWGRY